MSVSWRGSHASRQASLPLGLCVVDGHSKSSSVYGSWFQQRAPTSFASPGQVAPTLGLGGPGTRRNPMRQLGTLSRVDGSLYDVNLQRGSGSSNRAGIEVGLIGEAGRDQSERVTSFMNKVTQEGCLPHSPRMPDLLDLPGRMVRAPRTHHVTPRNTPDGANYGGVDMYAQKYGFGVGRRGNTMLDMSPRSYHQHIQHHNAELTTNTQHMAHGSLLASGQLAPVPDLGPTLNQAHAANTAFQQYAPRSINSHYALSKYPLERSSTMSSIQNANNNVNTEYHSSAAGTPGRMSPRSSMLSQVNTMPDESNKFMRRASSFHGPIGSTTLQDDIAQRQMNALRPAEHPQHDMELHISRYMGNTFPNTVRSIGMEVAADPLSMPNTAPKVPMYWLYGSRGKPGMHGEEMPSAGSDRDLAPQGPNQQGVSNDGMFNCAHGPTQQMTSKPDYLSARTDRQDAYHRPSYGSYSTDQQSQSESDKTNYDSDYFAVPVVKTMSLPGERPKTKSILKNCLQPLPLASSVGIYARRSDPGSRLPQLTYAAKKNGSKRVTFAL